MVDNVSYILKASLVTRIDKADQRGGMRWQNPWALKGPSHRSISIRVLRQVRILSL